MNYKKNQSGYILGQKNKIESYTYEEYLRGFGADETTTPKGVAPRLFVDGNTIMTWGYRGNNLAHFHSFKNKRDAKNMLLEIWESNVLDNFDAPRFFTTKKELFEDFADAHGRDYRVVKRYFHFMEYLEQKKQIKKAVQDNRPLTTQTEILTYINENRAALTQKMKFLNELKAEGKKNDWQVEANKMMQEVSGNDFRSLTWLQVYELIKKNV